jgi:uncharacterized protein (TIGR00369 family)
MSDLAVTFSQLGARMAEITPQSSALGFRLVSVGPAEASMAVPYHEDLVGDPASGVIAGGVLTTLLDQVCGLAVSSAVMAQGRSPSLATLDLRIDYMRGAKPGREVVGLARCYKLTTSIGFVRAAAFEDVEDDPIATAQAAFALSSPAGRR